MPKLSFYTSTSLDINYLNSFFSEFKVNNLWQMFHSLKEYHLVQEVFNFLISLDVRSQIKKQIIIPNPDGKTICYD